jgi:hypothetical protein
MELADRIFWGAIIFLGTSLVWLKFFEDLAPIWVGALTGLALGVLFAFKVGAKSEREVDRG